MFPLDQIPAIQSNPENYRLLQEVESMPRPDGDMANPANLSPFAIVDVETTGLSRFNDGVTEFGMVTGYYDRDRLEIVALDEPRSWFNDCGIPISEEAQRKTKITDDMVKGRSIPWDEIRPWLKDALVIAYNAPFDRPFLEPLEPAFGKLPWACAYRGIDWEIHGVEPGKLEYVAYQHNLFYGSHRAGTDCLALAQMLVINHSAFAELVTNARRNSVQVDAFGFPCDYKDLLKARGYNWQEEIGSIRKRWWADIYADEIEAEKAFLDSAPDYSSSRARYTPLNAFTRFKGVS